MVDQSCAILNKYGIHVTTTKTGHEKGKKMGINFKKGQVNNYEFKMINRKMGIVNGI